MTRKKLRVISLRRIKNNRAFMPQLILYGRQGCSHCEQLRFALDLLKNRNDNATLQDYRYFDVDLDAELRQKYDHSVPVLVYGSKTICSGTFDIESLEADLMHALGEDY